MFEPYAFPKAMPGFPCSAANAETTISGAEVRPVWQVAASEGVVIDKIQLLMAVVTVAALVASAMGIASLMTSTIMERSREIGLMKALGARPWQRRISTPCLLARPTTPCGS